RGFPGRKRLGGHGRGRGEQRQRSGSAPVAIGKVAHRSPPIARTPNGMDPISTGGFHLFYSPAAFRASIIATSPLSNLDRGQGHAAHSTSPGLGWFSTAEPLSDRHDQERAGQPGHRQLELA